MSTQANAIRISLDIQPKRAERFISRRKWILEAGVAALVLLQAAYAQAPPQDGQAVTNRLTIPYGGAWINGALGGHYWQPDSVLGIARIDPAAPGANPPFVTATAQGASSAVAKAGGQIVVAQPRNAAGAPVTTVNNIPGALYVFVPDASSKSTNVVRFIFDPRSETITSPSTITVNNVTAVGGGAGGGRPVSVVLAPNGLDIYVGYIKSGDIMKVPNAAITGSNPGTPIKVGSTSDGRGVNSMVMFTNANGVQDLYLAELGGTGLSYIPDPSGQKRVACSASAICTATHANLPSGIPPNPAGLAADSTSIYIGDSPLNGTPGIGIVQWNVSTGVVSAYSTNINPAYDATNGLQTNHYMQYVNPVGLAFGASGELFVSDDPTFRCAAPACPAAPATTPPTTQGHLWKVPATPVPPSVTSISPNTGILAGGTAVTIKGAGFGTKVGATTVSFGAAAATSVSCSSASACTATSPANAAGPVDVIVTVAGQSSAVTPADQFTYQKVTVTGITPNSGPTAGGTPVTITGTSFGTDPTLVIVNFGAVSATVNSCNSITCSVVSPGPAAGGPVDVTVTVRTAGTSETSGISPADTFSYVANTAPFVTSLCVVTDARNPTGPCVGTTGSTSGGAVVKLTGGNLTAATSINFGANAAGSLGCTADGLTCTIVTPPSPIGAGNVGVTVTAGGQTSLPVSFTYAAPSATVFAFGITAPKGGMLWVPKDPTNPSAGGHWWSSDHANGFCRQDPISGGAPFAMNYAACDDGSIGSPGQAVYDSTVVACQAGAAGPCHYIYVPDNAVKSTAVWRLTFDSATETMVGTPEAMVPLADVRTLKPNGMALGPGPNGPALYVTDLTEANIRRLDGPAGDPRSQTLTIVGTTGDGRGANGTIGFIGNRLYISENRSASWLDITQCTDNTAIPCSSTNPTSNGVGRTGTMPLPPGVFISGVATDPVHNLVYAADSPGGAAATIWRWNATPSLSGVSPTSLVYLQNGTAPNPGSSFNCAQTCTRPTDGFATSTTFSFAFGIVVDPNNSNLMVTEDATAGNRSGRGRAWVSTFIP